MNEGDIAVIGMACRFPGAPTIDRFRRNLEEGIDSVTEITRWETAPRLDPQTAEHGIDCKWGAFIENIDRFDPLFFHIPPKQAIRMDPRRRLMLMVTWEALEHAGYAGERLDGSKTGVFIGASDNQYLFLVDDRMTDPPDGMDNATGALANRISHFLNFRGPSMTVDTLCSSSLMAIHLACQSIRLGESQTAVAGGVHLLLLPEYYSAMSRMKLLSPEPEHRVLDRRANGFVPGEGAGVVVLKALDRALSDNDTVYAVIKGSAANYCGKTDHITVPDPDAQGEVIRDAMAQSGVDPGTVSYVELSGAGTLLGDFAEAQALKKSFEASGEKGENLLVGSVKTNIGNLEAASGVAGVIKVVSAMNSKTIPPMLHFEKGNRFVKWKEMPLSVCTEIREWKGVSEPLRAGVNSFGIGGANVHAVIEAFDDPPESCGKEKRFSPAAPDRPAEIVTLSSHVPDILPKMAENLKNALHADTDLADVAYTLNTGRAHLKHRLALIAESKADLTKKLDAFIETPDAFVADGDPSEKVVADIFYSGPEGIVFKNETGRSSHPMKQILGSRTGKSGRSDLHRIRCESVPEDASFPQDPKKYTEQLAFLGAEYVKGRDADWEFLYKGRRRRKIPLPTYPFQLRKCWIRKDVYPSPPTEKKSERVAVPESSVKIDFTGLSRQEIERRLSCIVSDAIEEMLGFEESEVDKDELLSDYGVDSVTFVKLIDRVDRVTGIEADRDLLFDLGTVSDISRFFADRILAFEAESHETTSPVVFASRSEGTTGPRDVAIIGVACRFPGADNIDSFWENLKNGVDSVTEIPAERFDVGAYYDPDGRKPGKTSSKWGSFIDDFDRFDAEFFSYHRKAAEKTDPQHRLFLEQVWTAFEHAGYSKKAISSVKTGVFAGIGSQEYALRILQGNGPLTHHDGPGTSRSFLANRISHFFGLTGPSMTVDTACASSLTALHLACRSLIEGECDLAVAGGVNLAFDPSAFVVFSKAGVLSPTGRCRVFDEGADGYVRGEGVGVVVVKPLERAVSDGDTVFAVIKGSVVNHNGENYSITSPSLRSLIRLLDEAYTKTGVRPETVSYMEAGSTGTRRGDPVEIRALTEVFGKHTKKRNFCTLGSTKTYLGHLEAASGIAGLIRVVCSMRHGVIPPLLHFSKPNSLIDLDDSPFTVNSDPIEWKRTDFPRRAGVSNFGFGGANAHVVVEEGPVPERQAASPGDEAPQICTLSAKSRESLVRLSDDLRRYCEAESEHSIRDICHTRNRGRNHFKEFRAALVVRSKKGLGERLKEINIPEEKQQPKRIVTAFGDSDGDEYRLMRLFAGEPVFEETMRSFESFLENWGEGGDPSLEEPTDRPKAFSFACRYAAWMVLSDWGIRPDYLVGSSLGGIAAACASGALEPEDGLRLTGALEKSAAGNFGENPQETDAFETVLHQIHFKRPRFGLCLCDDDESADGPWSRLVREFREKTGASDARGLISHMNDHWKGQNVLLPAIGRFDSDTIIPEEPGESFGIESVSLGSENESPEEAVMKLLAALYHAGADLNWDAVYRNRPGKRIPLPTYPFQRKRFRIPS